MAGNALVCNIIITKLDDINGPIPSATTENCLNPPPPTKFKIPKKSPWVNESGFAKLTPGIVIVPVARKRVIMNKVKRIFLKRL